MNQFWVIPFLLLNTAFPDAEHSPPELNTSFMVISDPHYYDPALGVSGNAFERYLKYNGKLVRESKELMQEAVQAILSSGVEMVLIPGDLTKDGALKSHLRFAEHLHALDKQGIKVFVVPGNHDVNSGRARSYKGDSILKAAQAGAGKFAEIYGPYGYDKAIFRDSNSLSYITEPVEGLWIIGLDACIYPDSNTAGYSLTGGAFQKETLRWLETNLLSEEAAQKTKVVLMHHGILEHFDSQSRHFDEYLVHEYRKLSRQLARMGIKIVFTGHFHANDISLQRWRDGSFLFDIETGSLLTYPCPLRKITIGGDSMIIETQHIQSIPSLEKGLQEYAREAVKEGTAHVAERTMIRFKLNSEDAGHIANQMGDLLAGHCAGDEIARDPALNLDGVSIWGRIMVLFRKKLARGLVTDLPPADNQLTIHLQSGRYY
ncbi:MAG: metallophosphoesterase [Bacteroidota bacterium]